MKKIFILSILIAPIAAYATGPAAYDGDPEDATFADSNGPYATATIENGDSTTVVSASYVKGAYNDTIAAINNVTAKLSTVSDNIKDTNERVDSKRVSAVTTWGNDTPTQLTLTTASN